ncbi:MAG: 2-C-methyl-D-erythritol 4-phosphate cytidylyltransferase [Firmicutes bacterium]|nr:2-C-methyl-D-erythritol 4-phosphate cytidylyltransferase [[Eubacterium] siraeum]MCM1487781.1 2-C-methyl-D-erythritol 4-phosphate cytidylyltransferase [Bacillota bacterium]
MIFGGICAGGNGTRLGGDTPKQFLMLKNKPVICYSAEAMLKFDRLDKLFIAVGKDKTDYCKKLFCDKRIEIIQGGETRNETMVLLAEKALKAGSQEDILITHDAARPFVDLDTIVSTAEAAEKYGAAAACIPASDTVLRCCDGFLREAPPREEMYLAQTPQAFRIGLFLSVWNRLSQKEKALATDICGIFDKRLVTVKITEGSINCFKITYKEDLERAEAMLKNRS